MTFFLKKCPDISKDISIARFSIELENKICIFIFQKSKFKKTKLLDITPPSIYNTYKCTFGGILTNARRKCVFFNKRI